LKHKLKNDETILLTSLPRSGSTWVLRVLGASDNVIPFHEPDHLDVIGVGRRGMHSYIGKNNKQDRYYKVYQPILKGRPYLPLSISKNYLLHASKVLQSYLPYRKKILIKSVFSLLNTEWIYKHFSPRVVILLRNPFSIVYSIHRKWPDARLKSLIDQKGLINNYLAPYKDVLEMAKAPYEILAARVGAYYKVILSDANNHPSWILITHEQLCYDPEKEFKALYSKLNLKFTNKIERFIKSTNKPKKKDRVQHVYRVARDEIDKWRTLLSPDEISRIREFYRPFNNGYYDDL